MKITINGIPGYDGSYDFDPSYFTNGELHTIKRMSEVRAGEMQAAFEAGDNDLFVAWTAIALTRNGKAVYEQVLWDAKVGSITLDADPSEVAEDDADPPTSALESDESGSEKKPPSGQLSSDDSGHQENGQSRTGLLPSELSPA